MKPYSVVVYDGPITVEQLSQAAEASGYFMKIAAPKGKVCWSLVTADDFVLIALDQALVTNLPPDATFHHVLIVDTKPDRSPNEAKSIAARIGFAKELLEASIKRVLGV